MAATAAARRSPEPRITTRDLKDGSKIEYHLKVIQQPERARACGSGAKSSADRRPVDPPPVVELRIFSVNGAKQEDITFSYSANFFLFATLEVARPMAHGRVQQAAASQQVPVLTGMPVSGMAYLDRPTEAGYFIFPDLSVRHEGLYRLSFNLYEEMRERDGDAEPQSEKRNLPNPGAPDASFDWRMEVKSDEFTVYSAKKFPGLAESTTLSRTVAEQGCRVRIRRDVRMRRREGKNADYEEAAENDGYERGRASAQQENNFERERSGSGSPDNRPGYDAEQRRLYQDQYTPTPYSGSPVAPQTAAPPGGHLAFIGASTSQYQAPPQPQFAPPPAPAPQPYQQPQAPYHAPPTQYRPQPAPAPPTHNYGYDRQYPQSAYPSNPPRDQREYEPEFRRSSVTSYAPPPQQYPSVDPSYSRPPFHGGYAPHSPPTALAPLKLDSLPRFNASSPPAPLSAVKTVAPPLPSPSYPRAQEVPSYPQYSEPPIIADPACDPARSGNNGSNGKRPFDVVFSSDDTTKPLHNGMRPGSSHGPDVDDKDGDDFLDTSKMSYKRAAGNVTSRPMPMLLN